MRAAAVDSLSLPTSSSRQKKPADRSCGSVLSRKSTNVSRWMPARTQFLIASVVRPSRLSTRTCAVRMRPCASRPQSRIWRSYSAASSASDRCQASQQMVIRSSVNNANIPSVTPFVPTLPFCAMVFAVARRSALSDGGCDRAVDRRHSCIVCFFCSALLRSTMRHAKNVRNKGTLLVRENRDMEMRYRTTHVKRLYSRIE